MASIPSLDFLIQTKKNKTVYLSLLKYNEQYSTSSKQIIASTLVDSLGYFYFEGKLLSEKHALYRIHAKVDEDKGPNQLMESENLKNFHNFVFSNRDTIVFKKTNKFWFSSNTNTNPVDKELQAFNNYVNKLRSELSSIADTKQRIESSSQVLSELKSYANTKNIHPLVTLALLSRVQERLLQEDIKNDPDFYTSLQNSLNKDYDNKDYAEQFKELLTDLSKTETQRKLEFYQRTTYILGTLSVVLIISVFFLYYKLKRKSNVGSSQQNINLTNQEERIAELIIQEKSNKEIATELFISLSTVKTHIRNLYAKLEVGNREEFINYFKNHPRD